MFCNKCGKQLPDDSEFCSACGMQMNSAKNALKSNNALKIAVAVLAVVSVVAVVFSVLLATEILSFNAKKETSDYEKKQNGLIVKAPEIGDISFYPTVAVDESVTKIKLEICSLGSGDFFNTQYIAADYTDPSKTVYHYSYISGMSKTREDAAKAYCAVIGDTIYFEAENAPQSDVTYKTDKYPEFVKMLTDFDMYFGRYEKLAAEKSYRFECIAIETLEDTGDAYVYSVTEPDGNVGKCWVDADTGYWVKVEFIGNVYYGADRIITGDDFCVAELDYENAVLYQE